jgi:hypothetical protein
MTKLDSIPENLRVPGLRFPDEENKTIVIPEKNMVSIENMYLAKWDKQESA